MQRDQMPVEVIVISDSEDEPASPLTANPLAASPLTVLRSKPKRSATKRPVKQIANRNLPKSQTRLDQFFQTLTIKKEKFQPPEVKSSVKLHSKRSISSRKPGQTYQTSSRSLSKEIKLSPRLVTGSKRAATKGLSPSSKMRTRESEKPQMSELKGDDLWKAVVAQRRKPKSLTIELAKLDVEEPKTVTSSSSFDEMENLLITSSVVHSFPNDNLTAEAEQKDTKDACVIEYIDTFKNKIPEVIPDEPPEATTPIFRPREKITIKKKKKDCGSIEETANEGLLTSTPTKTAGFTVDNSLDLFSDNSLSMEESAISEPRALCEEYNRHMVVDCSIGDLNTVLLLKNLNGETKTCELQGFWADTPIKTGDIVNIFGEFDSNGYISIDMHQNNMIVVNPDYLVSGSVVASAATCVRRSTLGSRYRGYDAGNKYMLFGSILHEVFQRVLISEIRDPVEMRSLAENIAHSSSYAHDMYSIGMTDKSLMDGIDEYIPPMTAFLSKHVVRESKNNIKITSVVDIEETIWSPRFGMKGKVDATVDCDVNGTVSHRVPLELKTGRPSYSAEHKGQVTIYSMMLSEKEQGKANTDKLNPGLLVYLKDGSMQQISHSSAAIKGLVNLRNELCEGLLRSITEDSTFKEFTVDPLPEPINQSRICETCPHLISCSLHQRVFKDFQAPVGHVMEKLVPDTLAHLTHRHLDYFSKWSKLLLIESSVEVKWKNLRNLWTKTTKQRVESGACITGLTLIESTKSENQYTSVFQLKEFPPTSRLSAGNIVVIAEDDSKVVIQTTASVLQISADHVTLYADRKFSQGQTYSIDKYDAFSADGAGFTNLARLMEDTSESHRLRSIIIDGKEAEFDDFIDEETEEKVELLTSSLNEKQKHIVNQGLLTRDYLVIKGYPGTGKTSTIVTLVESLRAQGMSVLVSSYTNSAVDNILLKLKERDVKFIRLGKSSRVHPDIAHHTSDYLTKDLHTVDEVAAFYQDYHVVGATCLGTNHAMLSHTRFDVCILDEASQIQQPVSLGPLFYATRFILVGDTLQLPPLIRSNDAKCLGMEETLLDLLDSSSAALELTDQYRMNAEIMRLCNQLTYDNKLKCGTESISTATVQLTQDLTDAAVMDEHSWTQRITSGSLDNSLMWLNTAFCGSTPTKKATAHSNTEARVVCHVCKSLINVGVSAQSIGVITPYQAQVQLLKNMLGPTDIEVNTVDQYQGRDKSVIIISFAKTEVSCHNGKSEGILSDVRRLNVAVTRAKHKLILVGNLEVLKAYSPVYSLVNTLHSQQIINLPANHISESIS